MTKPERQRHLIYCIGPSGSGKTTWLNQSLPVGYLVFDRSPHLDVLLRGKRNYYADATAVSNRMFSSGLEEAYARGLNVGAVHGGKTRKERSCIIEPARAAGYRVTLVTFFVPASVCLARCRADKHRPRTARWRPIILNWYKHFEPLTEDEYDELVHVGSSHAGASELIDL